VVHWLSIEPHTTLGYGLRQQGGATFVFALLGAASQWANIRVALHRVSIFYSLFRNKDLSSCFPITGGEATLHDWLIEIGLYKDYGTKPPPHRRRSRGHCERSEAIFARKQRLLRRVPLLAMTVSPSSLLCAVKVLSHGPKIRTMDFLFSYPHIGQ
jgi:hypothetical protein